MKKILALTFALALVGCTNFNNRIKSGEGTIVSVDKHQTGSICSLYSNDNIQSCFNLHKGKKDGEARFYYESGKLKAVKNYKNGVVDGSYMEFYENGKVKSNQYYKNGYKNGLFSFYNKDGVKIEEGMYLNGLRFGVWHRFNPETGEVSTTDYKDKGYVRPD